jgi:hypothetical protein
VVDGTLIIDADQRKAITKPAQTEILKEMVEKSLSVLPDEVMGKKITKVIGCMMVTSERKLKELKLSKPKSREAKRSKQLTIPESTYLVTKREAAVYHGIFSSYGPANPVISINDPTITKTFLANAMHGDSTKCFKIAGEILEERKNKAFKDEEDLRKRVPSMEGGKAVKLSEYISFE